MGNAQSIETTATTIGTAPVFASPDDTQTPLRVARENSVLRLIDVSGEWCRVEFQDPELGRRVGYVQRRLVRIEQPAAVPSQVGATTSPRSGQVSLTRPLSASQRGDFSAGYVFMHGEDVTLPLGIAVSDGWRLAPNFDVVFEGQYTHGTIDAVIVELGTNVWSVMGGVRGWGGSRYGDQVRAFGQVLAGVAGAKASLGSLASDSVTGFSIQPGGGVEVPVTRTFAIRPQFDVLFADLDGEWGNAFRINVNAVFRLFSGR